MLTRMFTANRLQAVSLGVLLLFGSLSQAEWDTRGNVSLQFQGFFDEPVHTANQDTNASLSTEVEFYRPVGEQGSVTITPFLRIDQRDEERTHADLREFIYSHLGDTWEARVGLGKVFWGVAESTNPVDVINQTDSIENDDASAKLGQPMLNLLLTRDWGDIDLFVLPGFREQTIAGIDGRPRPPFTINTDNAQYESGDEERHIDLAARVSTVQGVWDLGFHAFHGTARNPLFIPDTTGEALLPFYYQVTQLGVDAQATLESWLLKAELVKRNGDAIKNHIALVSGFEYSFYDIRATGADIGIVSEWLYDDRDDEATQPFQNDLFIGLRLAMNDEQSLEGLLGVIADLDGGGHIVSLEASRRFGDSFKASVLMRLWEGGEGDALLNAFEREDNVQLDIGYFF